MKSVDEFEVKIEMEKHKSCLRQSDAVIRASNAKSIELRDT